MENNALFDLFVDQLEDMYSSEKQIVKSLPKLINLASFPDLREGLSKHFKETEHQVERLDKIFSMLKIQPSVNTCEAMVGLLKEADKLTENKMKSPALDAAIICAGQKIEHYEIATYGALRSWAKQLDLNGDIIDLIQATLDEEGEANKELTKVATGSFFTSGVNKNATRMAA